MKRKHYTRPALRVTDMLAEEHFLAGSTPYQWSRRMDEACDWEDDDADLSGTNYWYERF